MTTWVFLALMGALALFWALIVILLQNRSQLDVSNMELDTWCRTRIKISVGGTTVIASSLEEIRSQGLAQARADRRRLDVGRAGAVLPPQVIAGEVVIASNGVGFNSYAGLTTGDQLTRVVLYLDGIPLPWAVALPLDDGLWFATSGQDEKQS